MKFGAIGDRPGYLANRAREEVVQARGKLAVRQAAEKAWLALAAAADMVACRLPLRSGLPVSARQPTGTKARRAAIRRLEVAWAMPPGAVLREWGRLHDGLHGRCFYGARCRRVEVTRDVLAAREHVRYIGRLTRLLPGRGCP